MKSTALAVLFLLFSVIPSLAAKPAFKTLVIEDISFVGADIHDISDEDKPVLEKYKTKAATDFRNQVTDYLKPKNIFQNITDKATGSADEVILQTRFTEIQFGSPGRRAARFFLFFIPIGGTFDLGIKGRLLDGKSKAEILNQHQSTNTGWYKGDTAETLAQYSKDLAIGFAELVESFMTDEYEPVKGEW